ncbi:MAG: type IV toxin-antitoxin system AbiEi family antitoxin domain-containing protein [Coriobacteriia bacterium]|nr:type IV toxin-antitoxin system AbiEi family antitoxin domain-containing protein [Coriobacteriia bacterium]
MNHFDYIYEIAADNYGIVTAAQAKNAGVTGAEMRRWVKSGRLERKGQGVYKLVRYVPTPYDRYAEACALVGDDAYLYGQSVLAMFGLALVNPSVVTVATPTRRRKRLPAWVRVVRGQAGRSTFNEGIRSQSVADAIESCRGLVMVSRLAQAVEDARARGLLSSSEYAQLKKEFA